MAKLIRSETLCHKRVRCKWNFGRRFWPLVSMPTWTWIELGGANDFLKLACYPNSSTLWPILASHWETFPTDPMLGMKNALKHWRSLLLFKVNFPAGRLSPGFNSRVHHQPSFLHQAPSNAARVLIAISPMTDDRHRDQTRLLGGFSLCGLQKDSLTGKWDTFHGKWLPRDGLNFTKSPMGTYFATA